jgi:hypothetical protein
MIANLPRLVDPGERFSQLDLMSGAGQAPGRELKIL